MKSIYKISFGVLASSLVSLATSLPSLAITLYTISNIGELDKDFSGNNSYIYAFDINNKNQVAGVYSANEGQRAFIWDSVKGLRNLGTLPTSVGGAYSTGTNINDLGQVIGFSGDNLKLRTFVWEESTGIRDLGIPGSENFDPISGNDINNLGQVVGDITSANNVTRGFIWDTRLKENLVTIEDNSSNNIVSTAKAINDKGEVTGFIFDRNSNSPSRTYLRTSSGEIEQIGINLSPNAINNKTQIVGESPLTNNQNRAFLWDRISGVRDLGVLGTRNNGDSFSSAYGINNKSQVVGTSTTNIGTSGFIWSDGVMTDLQSLINPSSGWVIQDAWAINDNGYIVGNGFFNGLERAFLLAPQSSPPTSIPEPASISALISLSLIALYSQQKSKHK
ncbi:hypothetical protein CAL7716_060110 [Calothrix sp. PCC 7716]|nr:hypothetical protein CAL7716_060110 [Calothrix sp. PCC 7716]